MQQYLVFSVKCDNVQKELSKDMALKKKNKKQYMYVDRESYQASWQNLNNW